MIVKNASKALLLLPVFVVVSLGWASDLAQPEETGLLERAGSPLGIVKFAQKNPVRIAGPAPLPTPVEPESAGTFAVSAKGPVAMQAPALGASYGSVLVRPRGGAMSSPRQQADREIRRLIRRLD